jgi:hypothetical protein
MSLCQVSNFQSYHVFMMITFKQLHSSQHIMCVRTNVHFHRKQTFCSCLMVANSWNIQLFSVLAVVYANDGWKKVQFAYFDYFPVYYFVQVHSICLSMLFKTHSLVDYECTWLRLFQKRIGYTKSKKSLKIPKGQSESVYRTDNTMGENCTKGQTTIYKTYI